MAKIDGKFMRGVLGNHTLKTYRGEQIIQMKSNVPKSRLTAGTKKAAKAFGIASNLASSMRLALTPLYHKFYDGTMPFRLNPEVMYCLSTSKNPETGAYEFNTDSFKTLNGFEFNNDSPMRKNFLVKPAVTHSGAQLKVSLPEIRLPKEIRFPADATVCKLVVCTTMLDLTYGHYFTLAPQVLSIPYSFDHIIIPPHVFEFEIEPGCLCMTGISLQFTEGTFVGEMLINNKTFNPAAILDAHIANGEVDKEKTKWWSAIDFKTTD